MFQFHDEGQSPYLYKFEDNQWLWFESKTLLRIDFGKQTETLQINKSNHTCDEGNSNRFMQCMESYFSKQLGCILPWTLKNNNQENNGGLNVCKGKNKFKEFITITEKILKPEGIIELIKGGCFIPKCRQRSWDIRFKGNEQGPDGFQYYMPENTKVLIRKEVRLYTLLNFFAEVGGYLGLLLGESLLSYIIAASKWMQIFSRKLKTKCNKKENQEVKSSPA